MSLCVVKISWMVFVLFSIGACLPAKQGQSGSGVGPGSRFGLAGFNAGSTNTRGGRFSSSSRGVSGSGSDGNLFDQQLASIARFLAEILSFRPNRPFPRVAWTSDHVPVRPVGQRPSSPVSRVVKTSGGYQRARDFSSDAKYTQDIFDHMFDEDNQGGSSQTGSEGQKGY
uniref:Uncharacterized protein n=1 Tax=Oryzias melastigma TaxID=30732 RepID=A0A3B3D791_ORYME